MTKLLVTMATLGAILITADAARILVYFPMMSRSHSILGHGVVRHLLNDGHEVVHITAFPKGKPVKNLKEIDVSHLGSMMPDDDKLVDSFKLKNLIGKEKMGFNPFFLMLTLQLNKRVLQGTELVELLSDPGQKFDAVVLEWFFSDLVSGLANIFQCPLIWFGSTEAHWQVLRLVGEVPNPAYTVDIFSENTLPLGFLGRVEELWALLKKCVLVEFWIRRQEVEFYESFYPKIAAARGITMPPYTASVYNASLLLINSHPSYGSAFKLPQNAKYVGGYHVEDEIPALPEDVKKLMDNSQHGVVYFSMGSNLKSDDMSDEMKVSILQAFGSVKQDVLWKFEGDLVNVPKNVKLLKWAPQQSILAHPNLKVFITHGGQLSTTEAVHHGVPLIGIPILSEQHVNMKSVVDKGFGITLDIVEDLADQMKMAVEKVIGNPEYARKAKEISMLYHHRPSKPGPEMASWVNLVIKTKGATHLRSLAVLTPWYQKLYLDLAGLVVFGLYAIYFVLKKLVRSCRQGKKVKKN